MRMFVIPPALAAGIVLLAAGCSKSLAPTLGDRATLGRDGSTAELLARSAVSRSFRARLDFVGPFVTLDANGTARLNREAHFYIFAGGPQNAGLDTVPAHAVLRSVTWRRVPDHAGAAVPADSQFFSEAPVFSEDAPVFPDAAPPPAGEFSPGIHVISLQVPPRAGGGRIGVAFQVNFPPTAWWAGPDPTRFPRSSDGDGRAVDVLDWAHFTTSPAWPPDGRAYFGPDSFAFRPLERKPLASGLTGSEARRTFYEIFGDRIYARAEGDTVHQNAWVVFVNGGFDADSRYTPKVVPTDPELPPGYASMPDRFATLIPGDFVGSPIGFRSIVITRLTNGLLLTPTETSTYPVFDAGSVFFQPVLARYWRAADPGKAYGVVVAEDAEGAVGRLHDSAVDIADRVDAGGGSAQDRIDRRQILTFYVRASGSSASALGPAGRSPNGSASARPSSSVRSSNPANLLGARR